MRLALSPPEGFGWFLHETELGAQATL